MFLICGYGIFGFFLFHTFYLIYGVSLFFRAAGNPKIMLLCPSDAKIIPYMYTLGILGMIFNIINMVVSWARPVRVSEEIELPEVKSSAESIEVRSDGDGKTL